jgi:uncharacterized delta-60 repeat protein
MSDQNKREVFFDSEHLGARLSGRFARCLQSLLLALFVLALFAGAAQAQSAADGFDPNVNGSVFAIAVQSSGKIVIGGIFTSVNGVARDNLARLNPDGTLDTSFTVGTNGGVNTLVAQSDGKIVVGGVFTTLGGQPRNNLGRISGNATDASFNPNPNSFVSALLQQTDGKIVVGGFFTTMGNLAAPRIARLNTDGSLDEHFITSVNDGSVVSLAIETDGQILLGGSFTSVNGQSRNRLARVSHGGGVDQTFNPNVSGSVAAIAVQPGGRIVFGGSFTSVNGQTRNRLARLNDDGSLDAGFNPNVNNVISAVAVQPDGDFLVGGDFTNAGGQARNRLARFNFDGSLDTSFAALINDQVHAIGVQGDRSILIGGGFTAINLLTRNHLARLYPARGTLDNDLTISADGVVQAMAAQPDGKILIGGQFTEVGGVTRNHIARLNADGSLDSSFNPNANAAVYSIALLPDGKILVGGAFAFISGGVHPGLARLNADGSFDPSFTGGANNEIFTIAVQPDGKIVIGGKFTTVAGSTRNRLARLNADGTLDSGFNPNANDTVWALALEADGQIVIGGDFTNVGGVTRNRIAQLNSNGAVDGSFTASADDSVYALLVHGDGKILVGGSFTTLNGVTRNRIGRLNSSGSLETGFNPGANSTVYTFAEQMNGTFLVGGAFTQVGGLTRNRIARVNYDGTMDTDFNPGVTGVTVSGVLVMPDGKIFVGGNFTQLAGLARNFLGRLRTDDYAWQNLKVNDTGTQIDWQFVGSSPSFDQVVFELSTNGVDYSPLAPATRVSGGWRLTGLGLQPIVNFFVRARGTYTGGAFTGSKSVTEAVRAAYLIPCFYNVSPTSHNAGAGGGLLNVDVTAFNQTCDWAAQSNAAWMTVTGDGPGSQTISCLIAANPGIQRTGTLTIAGTTITVTQAGSICPTIVVNPATPNLPVGQAGQPYNQAFSALNGFGPYTYSLNAGSIPNGMSLSVAGVLTGTPTSFGSFNFTVKATDSTNCFGTRAYTLTINPPCAAITVNPSSLTNGTVGTAYNQTATATGGTAPYTYTISAGTLPGGLTLASGGALTGTPNAAGVFSFTIKATDASGCFGTRAYSVTVTGAVVNTGLQFYPLERPVRILDTRAGQGNCDNISAPINGGSSLSVFARLTCEGIVIPANAQAVVGNVTVLNKTAQTGYMTIYPDGQNAPLAASMIYGPNGILANNFTVGLNAAGNFNIFGEKTIDAVVDISGYYAPPAAGGLYYHPLSKPIRLLDTRAGQGNCDNVNAPIAAGTSITTLARTTCEGLTIPAAAQAIVGNATVINGSGQTGYLTIYPNGVAAPLAANMVYFPGQVLSNAFTVSLSAAGEFNIFGEKTIDMGIDVAGYYSNEANDANGAGLLFTPLATPVRLLDTRAGQGNCDSVNAPITSGTSLTKMARMTCEGQIIPNNAQAVIGNVTVINQMNLGGYLTLYPTGQAAPLAANMIYQPNQILSNAFVVGLSAAGQFNLFAERTLDAIVDVSGFFTP